MTDYTVVVTTAGGGKKLSVSGFRLFQTLDGCGANGGTSPTPRRRASLIQAQAPPRLDLQQQQLFPLTSSSYRPDRATGQRAVRINEIVAEKSHFADEAGEFPLDRTLQSKATPRAAGYQAHRRHGDVDFPSHGARSEELMSSSLRPKPTTNPVHTNSRSMRGRNIRSKDRERHDNGEYAPVYPKQPRERLVWTRTRWKTRAASYADAGRRMARRLRVRRGHVSSA